MMSSPSRQYISKLCNLTAFQDQNVITFEANETKPTKFYLGKVVDVLLFMVCIALRNFFIFLTISIVSIHNRFGHAPGRFSEWATTVPVPGFCSSRWGWRQFPLRAAGNPKIYGNFVWLWYSKNRVIWVLYGRIFECKICYSSQRYSSLTCPLHRTWLQMGEGGGGVIQHL